MISWRHNEKKNGRPPAGQGCHTSAEPSAPGSSPASIDDVKPTSEARSLPVPRGASSSHVAPGLPVDPIQGQHCVYSPTSLAWWGSAPVPDYKQHGGSSDAHAPSQGSLTRSPLYRDTSHALVPYRNLNYEEVDCHEARSFEQLSRQLASFYRIGNGVEPFSALPQFLNPKLDALFLTRSSK
jgi:hypothetical protein